MKKLIIISLTILCVILVSGCIEATYSRNGIITSLTRYEDGDKGDLLKIGFENSSSEIVYYDSVSKYNLRVGDDVVIRFKVVNSVLDPMEVKDVWIKT